MAESLVSSTDYVSLLSAGPDRSFDDLLRLARSISQMPVSLFYVWNGHRGALKARMGVYVTELCAQHMVVYDCLTSGRPQVVWDTHLTHRTLGSLYSGATVGEHRVRSFISVPVYAPGGTGAVLGVLATCDSEARTANTDVVANLVRIGRLITDQVEVKMQLAAASLAVVEAEVLRSAHQRWMEGFTFGLRTTMGPLQSTLGLLDGGTADMRAVADEAQVDRLDTGDWLVDDARDPATGYASNTVDGGLSPERRLLSIARKRADDLSAFASAALADDADLVGPLEVDVELCELSPIIGFIAHSVDTIARSAGRSVRLTICDEGSVMADRARLGIAVQTLICDALADLPVGASVEIVQAESARGLSLSLHVVGAPDPTGTVVPLRQANEPTKHLQRPDPWVLRVAERIVAAHDILLVPRHGDAPLVLDFRVV